jgi:hypothetical protein
LRPQLTVAFDDSGHPSFNVASNSSPRDSEQLIDDVYRILAEMAEDGPAVLMLDEFQAVADLSERLPGLLKALSDEFPKVSLVLAGSRQHLMEALVLSKGAPLYNMAERLALGPVEDTDMLRYLQQRTEAGGKAMSPKVASDICNLVGPIPHDIQRLAYEAFDVSPHAITALRVDDAMAQVVAHEAAAYSERFARLPIGHRRVLEALAKFEVRQPNGAEFVSSVGYANAASVSKAIKALQADEMVFRREDIVTVSDPFLRDWLRRAT